MENSEGVNKQDKSPGRSLIAEQHRPATRTIWQVWLRPFISENGKNIHFLTFGKNAKNVFGVVFTERE
jgi:hypothetical protein